MLIKHIHNIADIVKTQIDFDKSIARQYYQERQSNHYQAAFEKKEPLVSICIGTYNREELLLERTVPSILGQTYKNIEVIIVGDHCTDNTFDKLSKINDKRLVLHNLQSRGEYPVNPKHRWMVAGTTPFNHALKLSSGDFITHIDDDDEYTPDRIEKLIGFALNEKIEFVWHPFYMQDADYNWYIRECMDFQKGSITTSSCFYHHWFKNVPWDINAWKLNEPGDWNRFRKIRHLKPKAALFNEVLLYHYREKSQETS